MRLDLHEVVHEVGRGEGWRLKRRRAEEGEKILRTEQRNRGIDGEKGGDGLIDRLTQR